MIEHLNSIDSQLFLSLNSKHSLYFDPIMYWFSDKLIWIPMYLLICFLIVKNYKMNGLLMLLFMCIVIALCDQITSHLIKNTVMRLRPSHEPALAGLVHLSKAGAGGMYGFVSSHAANSFGMATYLYFVLDKRFEILKLWLYIWAFLVSYSRIYNGVHYPGDVLTAIMLGSIIGWSISKLYKIVEQKLFLHSTK